MTEQEAPELTSFHGHKKLETLYRTAINENNLKTRRKEFPCLRYKEETTARQVEGVETHDSQDPQPWGGNPQTQLSTFSPRSEGSKPHIRLPSLILGYSAQGCYTGKMSS